MLKSLVYGIAVWNTDPLNCNNINQLFNIICLNVGRAAVLCYRLIFAIKVDFTYD